jgi:hypothetical protein
MPRPKSLVKLLPLALLATTAIGAAGAAPPASALSIKVCKEVPTGLAAVFSDADCIDESGTLKYAWAFPAATGLKYCVEVASGSFTESLCIKTGTGKFEKMQSTVPNPPILSTTSNAGKLAGGGIEISCTASKLSTTPNGELTTTSGKVEYTGCTVTPNTCTVAEPLVGEFTGAISEVGGKPVIALTGSKAGTGFFTGTLKGTMCSAAGKFNVLGKQKCTFDAAIESSSEEHEIKCAPAGSELELGSATATYEGSNKLMVEGVLRWKIR